MLLPVGLGSSVDAFRVSGRLKMERLDEFRRIKGVVEFVLVEHLEQFPGGRIEPSRHPEHGPGENAVLRFGQELLRGEFNELLSGGRIGGGGNVPGLIPGFFGISQHNEAPRGIRREGERVLHGIVH